MDKSILKIYELKGLIGSLSDIAEMNEEMDHPIIHSLRIKMDEVIEELEGAN